MAVRLAAVFTVINAAIEQSVRTSIYIYIYLYTHSQADTSS